MFARAHLALPALVFALILAALADGPGRAQPAAPGPTPEPAPAPEIMRSLATGYLPRAARPSSLTLLPPPPTPGSPAQARDDAAVRAALPLRGGPRWEQATQDAELRMPAASEAFACALGIEIDQGSTPRLYRLLQRSEADLTLTTYPTKTKYQRARPFTINKAPMCTPKDDALLRGDGSYPSGHSAIGWGWALILTEAAPSHADALLARGRAYGQSRVICNAHWLSDIEEARVMAAGVVARLHGAPEFLADLEAARGEIVAARAAGSRPSRNCLTEAARLAGG